MKKSFFSPKVLLITSVAVLFAYLIGVVGVYSFDKFSQARSKEHAAASKQAAYDKLTDEERAIQKTENLLKNSIATVSTSERVFYSYLQRKFDLPKEIGAHGPPIDLYENPRNYPEQIHFLARIAYPEKIVKVAPSLGELDSNIKITNIYSANCDHTALPKNFWPTMEASTNAGGYEAAHVALAFAFMKDNGCNLAPNSQDLKQRSLDEMVQLAVNTNTIADLRYEAIAFLLMDGRMDLVKPEWIDKIVLEQREDGGWSSEVGGYKIDNHSTLLAYWSLLEYSRPTTPYEPLILRPAKQPVGVLQYRQLWG